MAPWAWSTAPVAPTFCRPVPASDALATDIPDRGRQSFDGSLAVFHVGTQPKGDFEISICHLRITFGGKYPNGRARKQ
ncbi:hypothetical protein ACMFFR_24185 [Pseudomonas aeruginosa]|uniref:hypothetical protein n=1 Tax=Pseudomonas aeruginosa TaxID=287 RepID=UPI003D001118